MQVAAAWPTDQPLFMLHSGRLHRRWSRWSILARPVRTIGFDQAPDCDPMVELESALSATRLDRPVPSNPGLPFFGGWIGYFSYDLGRVLEPRASHDPPAVDDRGWPALELAHCPSALVHDGLSGQWYAVGEADDWAERLRFSEDGPGEALVGDLNTSLEPDEYARAVARTIDYIAAGDIFQANITRRVSASFEGSTRGLLSRALPRSEARYGAYLELPGGRCVLSLSPELFLDVEPGSRRVTTRPIKGTRPSTAPRRELVDSAKDSAELHMIVDLMRNDLGRVCAFGSVRVPVPRAIETYPTVHHGVAQVTGRLRPEVSFGDLLRATFPGGSVTGAPKIRAMQVIDELEPVRRGPYCGAIGFLSDCGRVGLSIAIRTIALSGRRDEGAWDWLVGTLDYGTGAGIVADSDPLAEYDESVDKAAVLHMALEELAAVR